MERVIRHRDADVRVEELPAGKRAVTVTPRGASFGMPYSSWTTAYPLDLIALILETLGPGFLCDEMMRDEAPEYVEKNLRWELLAYAPAEAFNRARILDFGCGCGASTTIMRRMFPDAEIVGVELDVKALAVARARAAFYGDGRTRFLRSPSGETLPPDIGTFDFVVLSAVLEHLLPAERPRLLAQLWGLLRPGGILFVGQTPYRWFPVELHTTGGLPFINYLPAAAATALARRFSRRKLGRFSDGELLRMGIRGASIGEILDALRRAGPPPRLLEPRAPGVRDRADLWFAQTRTDRLLREKRVFVVVVKAFAALTGVLMVPSLSLALRKPDREAASREAASRETAPKTSR